MLAKFLIVYASIALSLFIFFVVTDNKLGYYSGGNGEVHPLRVLVGALIFLGPLFSSIATIMTKKTNNTLYRIAFALSLIWVFWFFFGTIFFVGIPV